MNELEDIMYLFSFYFSCIIFCINIFKYTQASESRWAQKDVDYYNQNTRDDAKDEVLSAPKSSNRVNIPEVFQTGTSGFS